jgi:hypothetical protein
MHYDLGKPGMTYKWHHCTNYLHDSGDDVFTQHLLLGESLAYCKVAQAQQLNVRVVSIITLTKIDVSWSLSSSSMHIPWRRGSLLCFWILDSDIREIVGGLSNLNESRDTHLWMSL